MISSKETFSELRRVMLSPKGWYHLTEITGAFPLVKCLGGCSVCSWLPGPTIFLIITLAFGHDQEAWLGKWILRNTYPLTGVGCPDIFCKSAVPSLALLRIHSSRNPWPWAVLCNHLFYRNQKQQRAASTVCPCSFGGGCPFFPSCLYRHACGAGSRWTPCEKASRWAAGMTETYNRHAAILRFSGRWGQVKCKCLGFG